MNRAILRAISLGCALQAAAAFVIPSRLTLATGHLPCHSKGLCNLHLALKANKCTISRQRGLHHLPRMSSGASNTGSIAGFGESGGDSVSTGLQSNSAARKKSFLRVLWDFTRPHTIIGSILSVVSLHLFALTAPGVSIINLSAFMVALTWSLVCASLVNLFVTGLNQIYDVDIDKINKPYLPIPAGELSLQNAKVIVLVSLILGILPTILFYPFDKIPLLAVTGGSCVLGTLYSMPPFRLKRFPLLAAICIIVVRGTLVNLSFYAHTAAILGTEMLPARSWIASSFFALFGCVIALMKDVPDVSGDREFQVKTLSVRFGSRTILSLGTGILSASFTVASLFCLYHSVLLTNPVFKALRFVVALFSGIAAVWVHKSSRLLLQESEQDEEKTFSEKAYSYYMDLWKLFYASYLLLPFAV